MGTWTLRLMLITKAMIRTVTRILVLISLWILGEA